MARRILLISFFIVLFILSACSQETYSSSSENASLGETGDDVDLGETGDDVDDFGACNDDAQTYCSGVYTSDWSDWALEQGYTNSSWKYALVDCLGQNRNMTTQACDDSLDRRQVLNEEMVSACADDQRLYCVGIEPDPGEEPLVDCLEAHRDSLSEVCREALDDHEDAKSLS